MHVFFLIDLLNRNYNRQKWPLITFWSLQSIHKKYSLLRKVYHSCTVFKVISLTEKSKLRHKKKKEKHLNSVLKNTAPIPQKYWIFCIIKQKDLDKVSCKSPTLSFKGRSIKQFTALSKQTFSVTFFYLRSAYEMKNKSISFFFFIPPLCFFRILPYAPSFNVIHL